MRKAAWSRPIRALGIGLWLSACPASGEEPPRPADAILTELGLSAAKTRYVFEDDERALAERYREARDARDAARQAAARVEEGTMIEQGILQLQAAEHEVRSEVAAMKSGVNSAGSMGRGRRGRGGGFYRNQANAAVRQEQAMLRQLQAQIKQAEKQKPDAKQAQASEAQARQAMGRFDQALKELNEAYDALVDRYSEARSRPGVLEALEAEGRVKKVGLRLGPSEESEKMGKWAKGLLKLPVGRPVATPAKRPGATPPERP